MRLQLAAAIIEMCHGCSAGDLEEITNCRIYRCALHPYREFDTHDGTRELLIASRKYCRRCMNNCIGAIMTCIERACPLHPYRLGFIPKC